MGMLSWFWGFIPSWREDDDYAAIMDELNDDSSLFSWLWSLLIGGKSNAEEIQRRREEDRLICNQLLLSVDKLDQSPEEENTSEIQYEGSKNQSVGCCLRSGQVTSVDVDNGFIDGNLFFEVTAALQNLQVGDTVSYLAYRAKETDVWLVKKILPMRECNWDETYEFDENAVEHSEDVMRETMFRSELRQVTGRKGREVIVNDGEFRFNLDKVTTLFTPIVGDFIFLDAIVERDENVADFGGQILDIERIRWVRCRLVTAQIVICDANGEGVIGTDIYFNRESCVPGYKPCLGDEVTADAIESYQGKCSWRALLISPVKSVQRNVRVNTNARIAEVKELCRTKNGVSISPSAIDFGKIQKDKVSKTLKVKLSNTGDEEQVLMYGDFHLARRNCQVFPNVPIEKRVIHPGDVAEYEFTCRGKFIGLSKELFVFCFNKFKIGCNFEMDIYDAEGLELMSQDATVGRSKWRTSEIQRRTRTDPKCVIKGQMPSLPPKFIPFRYDQYQVPERFWKVLLNESNILRTIPEIEELLLKACPSLGNLTFRNYRDRFHTLLYLEEIDSLLKVQKFSMKTVLFQSAGEYLALSVPGLAEQRPSLLVGDRVLATRPWKDSIEFEGFVHKTFGKTVWLKFNQDFHLTYNHEVVDIDFVLGRSMIRRQHGAVDIVMTNLGEQILFPSKMSLKEPQIDLQEHQGADDDTEILDVTNFNFKPDSSKRKLIWFNKSLNNHQRLAVRNVLKGEARPLPYVIFGPPGTGKTVTLVEAILQILFQLPDSRLLVATPSNSSANLITERLLNSGLLKPGDLVRLVAYHVFEDGSLPEKIRPYATTGVLKETQGDEAKASCGELQESSNKNTIGRHRITIGTCIALGQLVQMAFPRGHFTHVVIDEAGQATEPEIMVPLGFLDVNGQAVLAGDPLQLGPVVGSQIALKYGLGLSYLERLVTRFPYERDSIGFPDSGGYNPNLVSRLVDNYRSLPEILALPNSMFYESALVPQVSAKFGPDAELLKRLGAYLPERDAKFGGPPPILFHGVVGKNLQDEDSPSWFNPHETLTILEYLNMAYRCDLGPDDVGIITPYRKQVQKMRWYYNLLGIELPKIGSVEEFQGQERRVIIMSTVRSTAELVATDMLHSLGFVASPKRLNVGITRARSLLVIVGNPHLLCLDSWWRTTIKYCIERQCYTGCDPPLSCVQN